MDDEVKGTPGSSLNYKYRMHDPRVGRFFAVNPLTAKYPHYTPYSFSGNKVIHAVELEGLEEFEINTDIGLTGTINGPYRDENAAQGAYDEKRSEYFINVQNSLNNLKRNTNPTWEADGKIYTQVTANTLVIRGSYANDSGEYKFIYPSGGTGLFGENASDGLNYYRCAGCHANNGAYRYAAYNSQERQIANGIVLNAELFGGLVYFKVLNTVNSVKNIGVSRNFWKNSINFRGIKVYQRADIFNPETISSWKVNGKTVTGNNIQRMKSGKAPIGIDGYSVNLHHSLQTNDSNLFEIMQTFHKKNHGTIHINDNTIPSGINRQEFNTFREDYWINRANDFK